MLSGAKMSEDWHSLYRDPRWQKKRLEVLERAEWCCQTCGESELELQVHHGYYEGSKKPWEYEPWSLFALCDKCHEEADWARRQIKSAGLPPIQLQLALGQLMEIATMGHADECLWLATQINKLTEKLANDDWKEPSETHNSR